MPKFRKKPVVIEAIQIPLTADHSAHPDVVAFMGDAAWVANGCFVEIPTLEGTMTGAPGDWIIRGVEDELYPCKPDIFAKTYEPAGIDDEPLDAQLVLALLYEHEINCGITSFWDEGYRAWIGDDLNGRQVEAEFHPNPEYGRPIGEIGNWLWQSAVTLYPEIEKPRDVPTLAAE